MRVPSDSVRRGLAEAVNKHHQALLDGESGGPARDYLTRRGIRPPMWEKFQLGFDGERLTIPYLTPAGPWHVKRRCIQDHDCKEQKCAKYKNDEGSEQHLFGAARLLDDIDVAVIVEGELDVIAVEQAGMPCVGVPGADVWKKLRHMRWCFDSVNEVVVVGDGDEPRGGQKFGVGEQAARAIADSLRTTFTDVDVRTVILPVPHDSNSFIQAESEIAFLQHIGVI